jgi:monoamine oxidase
MHKLKSTHSSKYSFGSYCTILMLIFTTGQMAWAQMSTRKLPVVVVGGGISGLTALHELGKSKMPALLFEERSTLGGRIRAFRTQEGHRLSAGAELIDSDNTELFRLARLV